MSRLSKVVLGAVAVWIGLTALHLYLNLGINLSSLTDDKSGKEVTEEKFRVGFLPVT